MKYYRLNRIREIFGKVANTKQPNSIDIEALKKANEQLENKIIALEQLNEQLTEAVKDHIKSVPPGYIK